MDDKYSNYLHKTSPSNFLERTKTFIECCDAFAELYREAGKVIPAGEVKDIYNAIFDDYFVK